MKPEHKEIVLSICQDIMDAYKDIENHCFTISTLMRK